tara:strand:- start:366 stop:857 length:492 start_codon:yes stop_codon:yes gene_type:complete
MDINDKFRKHYAEQGVTETDLADFNLDALDYIHWGNNSVAFPPFFQSEDVTEVTGYVYTGYHGAEGIRVSPLTLTVGSPDPRNPAYTISRLLTATDLNGVETTLIGLDAVDQDVIEAKVSPYVHLFQNYEPLSNLLAASFGPLPVHVMDFEGAHLDPVWTIHQ